MLEEPFAGSAEADGPARSEAAGKALDLFIAAPMSGYQSDAEYRRTRGLVMSLIAALKDARPNARIYFAGTGIETSADFTGQKMAMQDDLAALQRSDVFILIYPEKVHSSVLVEAGYALALRIPTIVLVRRKADLPYLFQEAENLAGGPLLPAVVTIREFADAEDLARLANAGIAGIEAGAG
jgi:nucleoside 2-deoxyribosyltransferase